MSQNQNQVLEFSLERRRETITSALDKMRDGFCLKSELTPAEIGFIFENYEHASTIKISSAGLHGGRHYSIHDLLGHNVNGMNYIVTEHTRFHKYISFALQNDFLSKNPDPDPHIRASFTSFMHENKLHWSKCCGNNTTVQNKLIREKLRELSTKTGKSHVEILSELLDNALNETTN